MYIGKRAQTTLEYALLITVVVAALLAMKTFMQKSVMGKLKESSNQIAKQFDPSTDSATGTGGFNKSWKTESDGVVTKSRETRAAASDPALTMNNARSEVLEGEAETSTRHEYEVFGNQAQ